MKKLKEKKFIIIIIVIILSIIYLIVQKILDNYVFYQNTDISSESFLEEDNIEENETTEETKLNDEEIDDQEESMEVAETEENLEEGESINSEEAEICVYVTGEVNNPGVVFLKKGSRIADAINAAGGITQNANINKINLAYILEDGVKVNIPNNGDLNKNEKFEYIISGSGDGEVESNSNLTENNSSKEEHSNDSSKNTNYNRYSIVNINTATQTELETLPGIGPSLALKIINYREENGKFLNIEDIKNVSGIGEKRFEEIKAYIGI